MVPPRLEYNVNPLAKVVIDRRTIPVFSASKKGKNFLIAFVGESRFPTLILLRVFFP